MRLSCVSVLALWAACGGEQAAMMPPQEADRILTEAEKELVEKYLAPLPDVAESPTNELSPEKIALGRDLFHDTALSNAALGGDVSCATCHGLATYGVDGIDRSIGILGTKVPVNAPSVYNAAVHFRQFWNGRADTVEEQALGPITAVPEMGFENTPEDHATVLVQLEAADERYPARFSEAFPADADAFTFANIGLAIGAFERTLLTPSRVDHYLMGHKEHLSPQEVRGLKVFLTAGGVGCVSCHDGVAFGGGQFRDLGVLPEAADPLASMAYADLPSPLKVPSLRNIEKTGPYFHNGTVTSLEDAVQLMLTYQLDTELTDQEMSDLMSFLRALTGDLPDMP